MSFRRGVIAALAAVATLALGLGCQIGKEIQRIVRPADEYPYATSIKMLMGNLKNGVGNLKRDFGDQDWENFRRNADHLVEFTEDVKFFAPAGRTHRAADSWDYDSERLNLIAMKIREDARFRRAGWFKEHLQELATQCNQCHQNNRVVVKVIGVTGAR
ncbi:MAG: hypothetical protein HY719_11825 [Planctomycetes bacterium]|nr:hypothetical protein [Planctomycetota bacterium]